MQYTILTSPLNAIYNSNKPTSNDQSNNSGMYLQLAVSWGVTVSASSSQWHWELSPGFNAYNYLDSIYLYTYW